VEVDTSVPVLGKFGLHVHVEEELVGVTEVGNDGHVLGELELVTVSESDGGVHELLHAFLPGSGQHEGVLDVEVAESVRVVVSKTSELVLESDVTPDGGALVNGVLSFESGGIELLGLEVENPSDSGLDVSVLDPPLVGDVGGSVVVEVSAANFEVSLNNKNRLN